MLQLPGLFNLDIIQIELKCSKCLVIACMVEGYEVEISTEISRKTNFEYVDRWLCNTIQRVKSALKSEM